MSKSRHLAKFTSNGEPLDDGVLEASDIGLDSIDNVSAADLRDRSTHTGTQTLSTISDAGELAAEDDAPSDGTQYARQDGAWSQVTLPDSPEDVGAEPAFNILSVEKGGTGVGTHTSGEVLLGNGTGAITSASRSGIDTRTEYPPSAHTHTASEITDFNTAAGTAAPVQSVNTQTGVVSLDAADVGAVPTTTTVTGANGLTGGGALSSNQVISHAETSSQGSVNNSGNTVIQDISLDDYGHVTSIGSTTLSIPAAANNGTLTVSGGTGLSGTGTFTADQATNTTITLTHADTSTLSGTYGSTANGTKIDEITVDANGHITAITTGATGDIDGVTAGTGLTGGGTSGTVTLNLDTTAGAIGTYAYLWYTGGITVDPGDLASGAILYYAGATDSDDPNGNYFVTNVGGTWRCMGYLSGGADPVHTRTVFIRVV